MIYIDKPVDAVLVRKVNRFLCEVTVDGRTVNAHIPNSGRLAELVRPGKRALLSRSFNPARKTSFTLKSVWHNGRWVCIDSTVPNSIAIELFKSKKFHPFEGYMEARREYSVGGHRFDLLLTDTRRPPMIVEIKSVTLVEKGVAKFPDAPTARGRSHLDTLSSFHQDDFRRAVLFIIQRSDAESFEPNIETDLEFGEALSFAISAGVEVYAVRCRVGRRRISPMGEVRINLAS